MEFSKKIRGPRAEQSRNTRTALISAGRELAIDGRFQSISVNEITSLANLSRPAFYRHFKSKDELLDAVLKDQLERYTRTFSTITPKILEKRSSIIIWIKSFIQHMRSSGRLNSLYYSSGAMPNCQFMAHKTRMDVVSILGHRLPQLELIRDDGSIDAHREIKILFYLFELEQAVSATMLPEVGLDEQAVLDELAIRFMDLIK